MEPTDAVIRILERIQETLATMDGRLADHGDRLGRIEGVLVQHNDRLAVLERHAAATNEILGIMNEQLTFFGRASTAAAEARSRLDDRMDALEQRVEAVERKIPG